MRWLQRDAPAARIELDDLPPEVRALLEAAVVGEEVRLTRGGEPLGTLSFTPRVLHGTVLHAEDEADEDEPATPHTEGVTVVATAMRLSKAVRARLSEEFGDDYLVIDMKQAPPTVDVLLVPPGTPQLVHCLRDMFPDARVVVTEIEDDELGVSYAGQVGRMLDAGASAYLPPRPIAQVAAGVRHHLAQAEGVALEGGGGAAPAALEAAPETEHEPLASSSRG